MDPGRFDDLGSMSIARSTRASSERLRSFCLSGAIKAGLVVTRCVLPGLVLVSGDRSPIGPRRRSRAGPGELSLICLVCTHVSGGKTILPAYVAALMLINTANIHHI